MGAEMLCWAVEQQTYEHASLALVLITLIIAAATYRR
jgi:hypothetical protein